MVFHRLFYFVPKAGLSPVRPSPLKCPLDISFCLSAKLLAIARGSSFKSHHLLVITKNRPNQTQRFGSDRFGAEGGGFPC